MITEIVPRSDDTNELSEKPTAGIEIEKDNERQIDIPCKGVRKGGKESRRDNTGARENPRTEDQCTSGPEREKADDDRTAETNEIIIDYEGGYNVIEHERNA